MFIIDILREVANLFVEMAPYIVLGLLFVGLLNLFFSKDLIVKHVGKNNFVSVLKAALLGVPLPLCSCGVVPTAVYMARSGASKGSVISFLISTPQTGIDSMIATYGMMGWVYAIYRPIVALIMGIFGGTVIRFIDKDDGGKTFKYLDNYKSKDKCDDGCCDDDNCTDPDCTDEFCSTGAKNIEKMTIAQKFNKFFTYSFIDFLDDISVQFVVGLIISGMIAYFIPEKFFENTAVTNGLPGMLIMIAIGIPMYVCATASIPIAITLILKGFSPGVAFVFLVTGPATNAASLSILFNVLGKQVTLTYLAVIIVSSIAFGYLLDWIFAMLGPSAMTPFHMMHHNHGAMGLDTNWFLFSVSIIFLGFLLMSLYRKLIKKFIKKETKMEGTSTIKIEGMTCNHCVMNVNKAITAIAGVTKVDVNLATASASVAGNFNLADVEKAVEDVGYKVIKSLSRKVIKSESWKVHKVGK